MTASVTALRSQIESVSQATLVPIGDRAITLKRLRDDLVELTGRCDTYIAHLDRKREGEVAVAQRDVALLREAADQREVLIANGEVGADELDAAGFISHEEIDALAEEGLLQEAASDIAALQREHLRDVDMEETVVAAPVEVDETGILARLCEASPEGWAAEREALTQAGWTVEEGEGRLSLTGEGHTLDVSFVEEAGRHRPVEVAFDDAPILFDPRVGEQGRLAEVLASLAPGEAMSLGEGLTVNRTTGSVERFKVREMGARVQTLTGARAAAKRIVMRVSNGGEVEDATD